MSKKGIPSQQTTKKGTTPQVAAQKDVKKMAAKPPQNRSNKGSGGFPLKNQLLFLAGIMVITFICYFPALKNLFTNWDDPGYVTDNFLIKSLSGANLKEIFKANVMGNYHPITILTYAIEYHFVKLKPFLYHFDNILFHLINTALVFWLVWLLSKRKEVAIICSLLFGIHPMHTESVAWIADRKDLLYTAFFLSAIISYHYYLTQAKGKVKYWILAFMFFTLSLLSKPVAVTLPVVLLLFQWYLQRTVSLKMLWDKLPFFALSLIFGIVSINAQKSFEAIQDLQTYNFLDQLVLSAYGLVLYVVKLIVPLKLSNFYPYPVKSGGILPLEYYIYPFAILALLFFAFRASRKNLYIAFGGLFFLVNIALLLQLLPVGNAIIADRYTYLPYFGLFYIIGMLYYKIKEEGTSKWMTTIRPALMPAFIIYAGFLGYNTFERSKVFKNTESLWKDAIVKYPELPHAYNNLGFEYYQQQKYDLALPLFNKAIELQPSFDKPYINRGEIERQSGNYPAALKDFNKAVSLNNKKADVYLSRAILYSIMGKLDSAANDFHKCIRLEPLMPEVHSSYGNYMDMTGKYDSAIAEYDLAIKLKPEFIEARMNKGRAENRQKHYKEAISDFNDCIGAKPDNGEAYYQRSIAYSGLNDKAKALEDAQNAQRMGFGLPEGYLENIKK